MHADHDVIAAALRAARSRGVRLQSELPCALLWHAWGHLIAQEMRPHAFVVVLHGDDLERYDRTSADVFEIDVAGPERIGDVLDTLLGPDVAAALVAVPHRARMSGGDVTVMFARATMADVRGGPYPGLCWSHVLYTDAASPCRGLTYTADGTAPTVCPLPDMLIAAFGGFPWARSSAPHATETP